MGMFDYITCEYPLGDTRAECCIFQTKDTPDCYLSEYTITNEGRLILASSRLRGFKGEEDQNFHGSITFYTDVGNEWLEYQAIFIDGNLVDIRSKKDG